MKKTLAVIGNFLAILLFCMGLISTLTPSEGILGIIDLLVWLGFPLALFFHAWRTYSSNGAKISVVVQVAMVFGVTVWLLLLQSGVLVSKS